MSIFARFPSRLQEAIVSRLGWNGLRPVQELASAAILDGQNAVVLAPTAGGKTEASIFPVVAGLMAEPPSGIGALYIAPIKALLNNQEERLGTYTEMVGLRRFVWHGDTPDPEKRRFVKEPAELLMTTPESLEVMLVSSRVPVASLFADLRYVIIDEVHALAGQDRGSHLMSVLERLRRFSRHDLQRIGLSATVGNPEAILEWLRGSSVRPGTVVNPPKVPARRELLVLERPSLLDIATDAASAAQGRKSLFFCQTRALTEAVADRMRGRGIDVFVHHSSVSLEERRAAEERFHHGSNASIIATSTLELGIDVGNLDLVFQANAPSSVSSFLQRMGRTGRRAGQVANTTFFCDASESVLQAIALIELAREGWVESVPVQARCWPVLVHQLLAMTLQFGGVRPEEAWDQLSRVPDFKGISRAEFDALLMHLLREEFLFEADGLLSMGSRAEKVFGRKNFMELYAVFSSPSLYRVQTATGQDIGSLEQDFVDRLVEEMSSFLLGGRGWTVEHVNHAERLIRVRPAPRGKQPSWSSFTPQMLSFALCQRIRRIIESDADYPYQHDSAKPHLQEWREDLGPLLRRGPLPAQFDGTSVRWWTFAGGKVNFTLKYGLEALRGWRVVADNQLVRIEGDGVGLLATQEAARDLLQALQSDDGTFWMNLAERVPTYRLSKFQQALPERAARELVGNAFLDLATTRTFLETECRASPEAARQVDEKVREEVHAVALQIRDSAGLPVEATPDPLPYPIAAFDAIVASQANPALRVRRRLDGIERAVEFVVGTELAVLRSASGGEWSESVRAVLGSNVGRPVGFGTWLEWAWRLATLLPDDSSDPVVRAARTFLTPEGKPSELARELLARVSARNDLSHGVLTSEESHVALEAPLTELWARLEEALAPLRETRLVCRDGAVNFADDGHFKYTLRLLSGSDDKFRVIVETLPGKLEEDWCYLLRGREAPLSLAPVAICRKVEDSSPRRDVFLARALVLEPGGKAEVVAVALEKKEKVAVP